jgi:hypothetical protein
MASSRESPGVLPTNRELNVSCRVVTAEMDPGNSNAEHGLFSSDHDIPFKTISGVKLQIASSF